MTKEQAQQVLDELNEVRPEMLTDEAKRLFEAIMTIADERDKLIKENKKINKQIERYQNMLVTNDMLHVFECEHKDEIIDLMSEQLTTPIHSKEWVKMYYENKVKERDTNENTKNNK